MTPEECRPGLPVWYGPAGQRPVAGRIIGDLIWFKDLDPRSTVCVDLEVDDGTILQCCGVRYLTVRVPEPKRSDDRTPTGRYHPATVAVLSTVSRLTSQGLKR